MRISNITKIEEGLYCIESLPCMHCKETISVQINGSQVWAMHNMAPIQEVLPNESLKVREQFISGTCPPCWTRIFGDVEIAEWI